MSRFRQLMAANQGSKYPANATVWEVTIPDGGAAYQCRVLGTSGTTIDWGDGVKEPLPDGSNPIVNHTYTAAGKYTVMVEGAHVELYVANNNSTYGKLVSKFIQASNTMIIYNHLLSQCSNLTELPSNFTIPATVTSVNSMLRFTNITALPSRMLLHEGITNVNNCVSNIPIKYLPDGFTIPNSAWQNCARIIEGNQQLLRLPESFRIPSAATHLSQFFYQNGKLAYIPKECQIPPGVIDLRAFAASGLTADVDIGELFAVWNPTSADVNLSGAFEASGVGGIAPADKLWNNPLSATWNVNGCFTRAFNIENFGEIPPTWGGGKIVLDDTTITMSDSTVDFTLLKEGVNVASFNGLYGVKVELTGLPDGLKGAWSGYDYKITGTLPEGSYRGQFTAHVYNKYDTVGETATITLIAGGSDVGGSDGSGNLRVSGVMATMAAMITPAFSFADGDYSLLDASASGHDRVWKLENGGTAFYFRWSETEQAWTLAETEEDPAMVNFPYIYSTVHGDDPWTSSGWEFNLTGPVSIEVTQA